MSVGTPPLRILDDYAPYHYPHNDIKFSLKNIVNAIQTRTPCEINEDMLRYAVTNDTALQKKNLAKISQIQRLLIQEKVDTFWPTIYRIFNPTKREPLTITAAKNSEMSLELDWNDILGFESIDDAKNTPQEVALPPIDGPISPEAEELLQSFEDIDLSASEKKQLTPAEVEEDTLSKEQHLFLETLGRSIFSTYVNDAMPLITKLITNTFKEKELLDVLAPHLQETVLAKFPESYRKLPVGVLKDIIVGQLTAFENSLGKIIDDDQKRGEIGQWIEELLKDPEKETKNPSQNILVFLMEQYVPDILFGMLRAIRDSILQNTFDPLIGTLLDIFFSKPIEHGIDIEEMVFAAETVLGKRLN